MEHSDQNRRYLAKVSRIGIIAATLYALIYGMIHFLLVPSKYAFGFSLSSLFIGQHNVFPEITVTVVGLVALAVGGILSLVMRGKPATVQKVWIAAGKAVLLAAPVGYIQSLCGMTHLLTAVSGQTDFMFSFATLATVFVGYALGAKGKSVNQTFLNTDKKTYTRHALRNTAIVFGVMLVSVLLLIGRQWKMYGAVLQSSTGLTTLLWIPLRASAPVALAVTVGYPLLSLAARLDEAPRKGRFGKGTILLGWVTLVATALHRTVAVLMQARILDYTANGLVGGLEGLQQLQAMQKIISVVVALLGIWTLCHILSRVKESKTALWGARSVLGVIVLRNLSIGIVGVIQMATALKNLSGSGMGIIGGADVSLTILMAQMESWLDILFTVLSVAALGVLTVGLTRRCRVGKGFWAVPVLTAASVVFPLLVSVVWELLMRNASAEAMEWVRTVFITAIPALMILARSLVGVIILSRTPAEEVPPPPTPAEGANPPKPRVEDYLYQL